MTDVKERVRFAPSPTGHLHIGNARTALFNYLFASRHKGIFILRIEDTDVERSAREFEIGLMKALRWLKIEWQEGPDCGGPFASYRQSERLGLYREFAQKLLDQGKAFHCYCTEEELEASRRAMLRDGRPPRYSGRCRHLSAQQRRDFEKAGRIACIRYRVPDSGTIRFEDRIHGPMSFRAEEIGDFVLMRSTGMPSYSFAVVIDDHFMEITTVIRGEDHLANTPRQVLLYNALGWEVPRFAHHALLMGSDRTKLSKRHGVTSVEAFRESGILAEALINYLALLGGSPVPGREVFTIPELIQTFSLEKAGKSAAIFDYQKLMWMNQQHLKHLPAAAILQNMAPFLEEAGYALDSYAPKHLEDVAFVLAENIQTFSDAPLYAPIFLKSMVDYDEFARAGLKSPLARNVLKAFRMRFVQEPSNDKRVFSAVMKEIRKELGIGGKDLFLPLRMALTGTDHGPELDRILPLLSPQVILKRIEMALAFEE